MKYLLLLYGNEKTYQEMSEEAMAEVRAGHARFGAMLEERGAALNGEELHYSGTAVTIRKKHGAVVRTDGPYVETTEHLGGFYLVEARDLDDALELAKACPEDIVEVRPVVEYAG